MGDYVQAWCDCGHSSSWHRDNGRCAYLASRLDHATRSNIEVPCECFELRIAHIEVLTWPDYCIACGNRHTYVDAETEMCGNCRRIKYG
jgi:hypothetical protein